MLEEWAKASREEIRQAFGDVGIHHDCAYYDVVEGKPFCKVCSNYYDDYKYMRSMCILQCEKNVCYFYKPRKEGNE